MHESAVNSSNSGPTGTKNSGLWRPVVLTGQTTVSLSKQCLQLDQRQVDSENMWNRKTCTVKGDGNYGLSPSLTLRLSVVFKTCFFQGSAFLTLLGCPLTNFLLCVVSLMSFSGG